MATYLTLVRYTSEGMKAALSQGFVARRAVYEEVVTTAGGSVSAYFVVADGDWDLAIISEIPEPWSNADAARMIAAFKAGGAVVELRTLRLATAESFDDASRTTEHTYRPPNG